MQQPLLIEFASPLPGTYPVHFDPSYWFSGLRTSVDWKQTGSLIIGGLFVLFVLKRLRAAPLFLWCAAAILMYALVVMEMRYLASFLVLLCVLIYSHVLSKCAPNWISPALAVTAVIATIFYEVTAGLSLDADQSQKQAEALVKAGLHPGDRLAAVRKPYNCYFVRLAGMRIIAMILSEREYQAMTAEQRNELSAHLRDIHVKALLVPDQPESEDEEDAPHSYSILTVPLS